MSAAILPPDDQARLRRWQNLAFFVGFVGVVVCLVGALIPDLRITFFRAWLVAFNFVLGIALGCLVVLMLQYQTGGTWGIVLRRPLEAATRTLPLLALLFVPLVFGLGDIYTWARPEIVEHDPGLQHKAPYLNPTFFVVRAAIYFAIWCGISWLLNRWSSRQDQATTPVFRGRCEALSAPGLILYVVTITFASIDWVMSLEPHWFSTIYGAMFGMGQVLSAFVFVMAVVSVLVASKPLSDRIGRPQLRDLGNLTMAFIMVWAYLAFCQFLLIWSGNLPEEVPWYVARIVGPWKVIAISLILLHFALPFVILLSADLRSRRISLIWVASLVLVMRFVDLIWLIVPAFDHGGHGPSGAYPEGSLAMLVPVVYAAALLGAGGLWLGLYLRELASRPLLPVGEVIESEEAHHG